MAAWSSGRTTRAIVAARFAAIGLFAIAAPFGLAAEFDARVKWHTTIQRLPAGDAQRHATGQANPLDHGADLRLLLRRNFGSFTVEVDHATTYLVGDSIESAADSGPTFDQTPTGDERRLLDLTWEVDQGDRHRLLHRFDRFALKYRTSRWAVTVGRDAVSWGSGVVFHPMDLFNPFAPTTVDQDYKAGDDLIRIERLFDDGSDLEVLAVARHGEVEDDTASVAFKYRALLGGSELDLLAGRHYGGEVVGLGLRAPIGGAWSDRISSPSTTGRIGPCRASSTSTTASPPHKAPSTSSRSTSATASAWQVCRTTLNSCPMPSPTGWGAARRSR